MQKVAGIDRVLLLLTILGAVILVGDGLNGLSRLPDTSQLVLRPAVPSIYYPGNSGLIREPVAP
jgi:hypothetical protein